MASTVDSRNPLIKRLLTSYRISSENSLSGPTKLKLENNLGGLNYNSIICSANEAFKKMHKNDDGFRQHVTFISMDGAFSDLTSTELEGETIACFKIGGENRLCLAQIIKRILSSFSLPEIHSVFASFHIFSAICSPTQLKCLKEKEILPLSAPKCGLITKSDAQRFCSVLLRGGNLLTGKKKSISKEPFRRRRLSFVYDREDVKKSECFGVAHKCFGGCKGTFIQKLYRSSHSSCIQCNECLTLLSPEKFVSHFHSVAEFRQTCHWGFDSANWRHYLELDSRELPEHHKTLSKIKLMEDSEECSPKRQTKENSTRRVYVQPISNVPAPEPLKYRLLLPFDGVASQEPPPLLHPMAVCRPETEAFAPNVSLLPVERVKEFEWKETREEEIKYGDDDDDDDDDDDGCYNGYKAEDDDDDDDDDDVKYHQRRNKVLTAISDDDVSTIQQLDEMQEAEMKLFKMALNDQMTDGDKANIFNEFCDIQKKLQTLLEDLVTQNKNIAQKYSDACNIQDKKDFTMAAAIQEPIKSQVPPHHSYKKRHCQTASPVLCSVKESNPALDSDGDDSSTFESTDVIFSSHQSSHRPPKRKRCNIYSQHTPIKMELC